MAKTLPSEKPFENYTVYGPYEGDKGGQVRRMVTLKSSERMTTMAYARYLVCVMEGRWLETWEDADHIDKDRMNDDPSNLRALTKKENMARNSKGVTMVTLICPVCEKEFTKPRNKTHIVKGGGHSKCSRQCAGKSTHMKSSIPSA